jgi:hypothetical protein
LHHPPQNFTTIKSFQTSDDIDTAQSRRLKKENDTTCAQCICRGDLNINIARHVSNFEVCLAESFRQARTLPSSHVSTSSTVCNANCRPVFRVENGRHAVTTITFSGQQIAIVLKQVALRSSCFRVVRKVELTACVQESMAQCIVADPAH